MTYHPSAGTRRRSPSPIIARAIFGLVVFAPAGLPGCLIAKTVDLAPIPAGDVIPVEPNLAVTFDDSGSMTWRYMGDRRPYDNQAWLPQHPWMCAAVIDPRSTDPKSGRMTIMNGVYYHPGVVYRPPRYADGSSFPDADATLRAVPVDGIAIHRPGSANPVRPGAPAYRNNVDGLNQPNDNRVANLSGVADGQRFACSEGANSPFNGRYIDPNGNRRAGGPYYFRLKAGINISGPSGAINPVIVYNTANWEAVAVPASDFQNFANWYAYHRVRHLTARTSISLAFARLGSGIRVAWQNLAGSAAPAVQFSAATTFQAIGGAGDRTRARFYDWLFQAVGANNTPVRNATIRAGELFRRPLSKDRLDPYWNGLNGHGSADLVCRKNFHMLITDGYWNGTITGAPAGAAGAAGRGRVLPDGRAYNPGAAHARIFANVERNDPLSLANIAFHYWATDLQPSLANGVRPYWSDLAATAVIDPANPGATPSVYFNPRNDPATWQHVTQFFVALGVAGTLRFPEDYPALVAGIKKWPGPVSNAPTAVDDTWHAGINSRGGFFSASRPDQLVDSLVAIFEAVGAASANLVSSTVNNGVLGDGTVTFVPGYNAVDWSGRLAAHEVGRNGKRGARLWDAGPQLDARGVDRLIITSPAQGRQATGFNLTNLLSRMTPAQVASLASAGNSLPDDLAAQRVAWVRGDRESEGSLLRRRSTVLGAVVHAQPVYVARPASGYRDYFPPLPNGAVAPETAGYSQDAQRSYSRFVADNRARDPTLYVAANDGMVHAFDARSAGAAGARPGRELWAYIPSSAYDNLWALSRNQRFTFRPTVDATPVQRDVYFDNAWHTVLVGGLRLGGRGVYALDITSPKASTSTDVAAKLLWEFSSETTDAGASPGENLGYTYGQPNIARLPSGRWVVLVPGGYFPHGSTAPAASNRFSSLFVLDVATGNLIKEWKTPGTVFSFGMTSPVLGDYQGDQVDDVAFAGDLVGNIWRFDLADLSSEPTLLYQPEDEERQPVTVMPRLFADPTSSYFIVTFGTGKFLGASDNDLANATMQSIYGIRDPGPKGASRPAMRADLVRQDLAPGDDGRIGVTMRPVPRAWRGWFIDLGLVAGERVVVTPLAVFDTNRLVVATLLPRAADPCAPETSGSFLVLDATTGGASTGLGGGSDGFPRDYGEAGAKVSNVPTGGTLVPISELGGGRILFPDLIRTGPTDPVTSIPAPVWRRRSWRLLNE